MCFFFSYNTNEIIKPTPALLFLSLSLSLSLSLLILSFGYRINEYARSWKMRIMGRLY